MAKKRTCDYNGKEVGPGTGTIYIKTSGTVFHFKGLKVEKSYLLGHETRDLEWMEADRRMGGKAEDNQMSDAEYAFVMVKPDGVQRGLIGDTVSRFEDRGLKIAAGKSMQIGEELAHDHYGEYEGKPFFEGLVDFITSGPILAMIWEGQNAT